jgi:hypothetical protein
MVSVVMALALVEYLVIILVVGRARVRCKVPAPATAGNAIFERYFRVQQNTLELLVPFLPGMWLFGQYVSPMVAAGLGLAFIAGRALYLRDYVADPARRGTGFGLSFLPVAILVTGGLIGAALQMAR